MTPPRPYDWYETRLALPQASKTRPLRIVIDSDVANEIDDQFALTWALLTPEFRIDAIYACPFSFAHRRDELPQAKPDAAAFNPPDQGMERSYLEAHKILQLLGKADACPVLRGSPQYMTAPGHAVDSEAARHLIDTARSMPETDTLYVVALGCLTNIASALALAPDIIGRIVVVWTAGFPSRAPQPNQAFNLEQDLYATHLVLDSGVPLVYLPGYQVGSQLRLSLPEMEQHVRGKGAIGDYLHHLYTHNPLWDLLGFEGYRGYSWVIWDVINFAWLLNPAWVPSELVATPTLDQALRWQTVTPAGSRAPMREAWTVQRDAVFRDFFAKLDLL